ncbi:MAG: lipopolysaccharide core heptose(I) kinase RfaP [Syntrophotaleaceae bacterium]
MVELNDILRRYFPGPEAFDRILGLQGDIYREMDGRRTLRFDLGGRSYFAKLHFGVGWREIFKNLLQGKRPVLGARNEREALRCLQQLHLPTMKVAGFGIRGCNPARRQSFLITEELTGAISLESLCRGWAAAPPPPACKRALLEKVAFITRKLHENGINHRDLYICHFLLEQADSFQYSDWPRLHLVDLHRAQLRNKTPRRWAVKDVAGLYFSSLDIGLTRRDLLRFIAIYRGRPLREILKTEKKFWRAVSKRAFRLYRKMFGRNPGQSD